MAYLKHFLLKMNVDARMESPQELENVRNEVLRKIGRNMLLYQQMEHMHMKG
jgi:hypothetical protein